jgi:sortase B
MATFFIHPINTAGRGQKNLVQKWLNLIRHSYQDRWPKRLMVTILLIGLPCLAFLGLQVAGCYFGATVSTESTSSSESTTAASPALSASLTSTSPLSPEATDSLNLTPTPGPSLAPTLPPQPTVSPVPVPVQTKFKTWLKTNSDTVGWIKINDTEINYPVVQAADNAHYLHTNYQGQESVAGAVFMDYRNIIRPSLADRHWILYAHNMKNGSMFQNLMRYKQKDFFNTNRTFRFDTLYENSEWEVFAAYISDTKFYFIQTVFNSDRSYLSFIRTCQSKSKFKTDIVLKADDQILTLVTCTYEIDDARFVVQARRVR